LQNSTGHLNQRTHFGSTIAFVVVSSSVLLASTTTGFHFRLFFVASFLHYKSFVCVCFFLGSCWSFDHFGFGFGFLDQMMQGLSFEEFLVLGFPLSGGFEKP